MSVLIKGMDFLPKSGVTLEVYKAENGETYIRESGMMGWSMKLVTLPEKHGRLIDADALVPDICHDWEGGRIPPDYYSEECIREAPTVIEAEGE